MPSLIKEKPAGIFDRREWWSLAKSCEATVAYGKGICSIHITDANQEDITEKLAEQLEKETGKVHSTTATIDSFFIECETEEVKSLLAALESVC